MKHISSRQNPEIKEIAALKNAKARKEQQRFIAEGIRTIKTIMQRQHPIQLYLTQELFEQHKTLVKHSSITLVSSEVMQKISSCKTPPGIIGIFAIPSSPKKSLQKGLVLAHITNPGNMGSLIRTAAAMDAKTVVIVDSVDPWSPKVIQATAGTITFVDIHIYSWQELLEKKHTLRLCALVIREGRSPQILKQEDILIVIGNEAHGIPPKLLNTCELTCSIPMPGKTESLNAAAAGSIALYLAFNPKSP